MPVELLLPVSITFLAIAVASGALAAWWLSGAAPEQRRLRALSAAPKTGVLGDVPSLTNDIDPGLARLSQLVPKSPQDLSRLRRRLTRAGYPQASAAIYYSLAEVTLPIIFGVGAFIVLHRLGVPIDWVMALIAAGLGYTIPGFFVAYRKNGRQRAIQNALPDALDLLTVSVEAGSGLEQAVAKASEELGLAHPVLAEELRLITSETRAGKPRAEAMRNFAARTGVDDVRALVAMLTQTDRFGTSISQALRTHAETARTKRRQRAEERAAKVSVKLVFPLALCLFPALYVVCFGPVVIHIYRAFY